MRDVFDLILPDEPDSFDIVAGEDSAVENLKAQFAELLERFDSKDRKKMTAEVKEFIRAEIAKIKPVQKVIRTIEKSVPVHLEPKVIEAPPTPPQIIRETRVEVQVPKKDKTIYAEASDIQALKKQIKDLKDEIEKVRHTAESPLFMPGGSGVIGIPPPEPNEGKTLKVLNGKAVWTTVSGGGASISGYTVEDATELKTLPDDASLDEIRQVLGSLITDLQS